MLAAAASAFLLAARPALAQRVVEAPVAPVPRPALPAGVAPVPGLSPSLTPSLSLPAALPSAKPSALALPAAEPAKAMVAAAAVPAPAAEARALPAAGAAALPEALRASAQAMAEAAPDGLEALDDEALIGLTKRLAGEEAGGAVPGDYLRSDKPFAFQPGPAEAYRRAKLDAAFSLTHERAAAIVAAARDLAAGAGIAAEAFERPAPGGGTHHALKVLPEKDGSPLNALAWALEKGHGVTMVYVPERTRGAAAAFNGAEKALFLPDFDREESYEAVLHEARHAFFATLLSRGIVSPFHSAVVAYEGMSVARGAETYTRYLSFEELSTYPKTLKHLSAALRRAPNPAKLALLRSFASHYADILRSARYNAALLRARLDSGALVTRPVAGEGWPAFPGGRWERADLAHGAFALPVLEEPEPAPAAWWKRPFVRTPLTPGQKAVARVLAALEPHIPAAQKALGRFVEEAGKAEPDAARLSDLADALVGLARDADARSGR